MKVTPNSLLLFAKIVIYFDVDKREETLEGYLKEQSEIILNSRYSNDQNVVDKFFDNLREDMRKRPQERSSLYNHILNIGSRNKDDKDFEAEVGLNRGKQGQVSFPYRFFNEVIAKNCNGDEVKNINTYFEFLNSFFSETLRSSDIESRIAGTVWYLYYHEYDSQNSPYSIISRYVLYIKNMDDVQLFDSDANTDFKSSKETELISATDPILIFFLKRQLDTQLKKLELRVVFKGSISPESVFLGQYMDFETGNELVSGTVVIENVTKRGEEKLDVLPPRKNTTSLIRQVLINNNYYNIVQAKLGYYTDWISYIPFPIASYLCDKWKNFTKTKAGISTLKDLSDFFI